VIHEIAEMHDYVLSARARGASIGVVPTMGALHEGHLTLVDAARRECEVVIVTIFVNPTQFGPKEDFAKYPRTLEADVALLAQRGGDVVFAPETTAMYGPLHATKVEVAGPALPLEGEFRPTHFSGVATIVLKLFNIVPAERAYFGRKDFQQVLVVRRMVADLDVPVEIVTCPIARDPDGLAMSSRNVYLSAAERERALSLSWALREATRRVLRGERDATRLIELMKTILRAADVQLDYVAICNGDTLEPLEQITDPAVALIAGRVGSTRLIDNASLLPQTDAALMAPQILPRA
jgi:pantoate--beta-alanine ligase